MNSILDAVNRNGTTYEISITKGLKKFKPFSLYLKSNLLKYFIVTFHFLFAFLAELKIFLLLLLLFMRNEYVFSYAVQYCMRDFVTLQVHIFVVLS